MNPLWLSHNFFLEDEARFQFSAIRLLIVSQKTEHLANIKFTDCSDIVKHLVYRHWENPLDFRLAHVRRRNRQRSSEALLGASQLQPSICTVVLELVNERHLVTLKPSTFPFTPASHLHVAFDYAQTISAQKPSLFLFLGCNDLKYLVGLPGMHYSAPLHCVRITSSDLSRYPHKLLLSEKIIRHIVRAALFMMEPPRQIPNWRTQLMSYGLVCKSWAPVLDLFFELLHEDRPIDPPNAYCVAHSLTIRPERAILIRSFSSYDFKVTKDIPSEYWQQILTVLEHATSVSEVFLDYVPPHATSIIARIFPKLGQVQKCIVNSLRQEQEDLEHHRFNMGDFQTYIADWKYLEELELFNWETPDAKYADDGGTSFFNVWPNLRILTLSWGWSTGSELMRFASPCLTNLYLADITGFSNHNLFMFLSTTASTIVTISVVRCTMSRVEGEEHALDAAMPSMIALTTLHVEGSIVSALALSRRRVDPRLDVFGKHFYHSITIHPDMTQESSSNEVERTMASPATKPAMTELILDEVVEAMNVTGWNSVYITWNGELDVDTLERAQKVARQRDIYLQCRPV